MLTYKRRPRSNALKRKNAPLDDDSNVGGTGESDFGESPQKTVPEIETWRTLMGSKKTVAPKRILGQYFLDLGQSDFSYSTCPICGLFYARGQENDEKIHKAFHRNRIQGIQFKGWQNERIVSRFDGRGNRVILVLSEDTHHQSKVREVIDVMEVELGLTPGWLLQRTCKVYLFISSSKKIVGCLMAEPIQCAFRVVNPRCQGSGKGVDTSNDEECEREPVIQGRELSQDAEGSTRKQFGASESKLPATGYNVKAGLTKDAQALPHQKSRPLGIKDAVPVQLSPMEAPSVVREGTPTTTEESLSHPFSRVKVEPSCIRDKVKMRKITEFFDRKSHVKAGIDCKPEWDACDSKADIKDVPAELEMDTKHVHNSEQDTKPQGMQLLERNGVSLSSAGSLLSGGHSADSSFGKNSGASDRDSRQGGGLASDVMVFGNIKFSREMAPRKRRSLNQAQDLGRAILCTKTPVPAVCGVRVIWVSQSERRKGIASHLLDTMRRNFCMGAILGHSQFAFSQPTPEGREFAARYCQTNEFLVYTTS